MAHTPAPWDIYTGGDPDIVSVGKWIDGDTTNYAGGLQQILNARAAIAKAEDK